MIAADFDLNMGGFFEKLKLAETAVGSLKLPTLSLGLSGVSDAAGAVGGMRDALAQASAAATPLQAALKRGEAAIHGLAAVARTAGTAMALLPGMFAGLPPAVGKTFSAVSLASRGFDVLRGRMTPLGGVMAYLELKNLGLSKSYSALAATLGVASSAVISASRRVSTAAATVGKTALGALAGASMGFSALLGPLAVTGGVAGVAAAAFAGLGKSISSAADFETIKTGFVTLLGTVDAASERLRDLSKFAADTPFELPEVARASRTLETLTKGALATGKGLTLVGDVASGVNQPFEDLAMWIGRLYDGLQSGRPVGEALMRLQELGVVSGDTRNEIEALQKAGQKGDAVWSVAEAALGRFAGNMKRQSGTWNGLLSNLGDNIGAVFREFGTPVMDALKPLLASLVGFTSGLAEDAGKFGAAVANAFQLIQEAFASGQLGELAGLSLQVGFAKAVNFLLASFRGLIAMLMSSFSTAPQRLIAGMKGLFDINLWTGLGQVLASIGQGFIAVLSSGLAPLIDKLIAILNKIPGIEIPFRADDFASASGDEAAKNWTQGFARMGSALKPVTDQFAQDAAASLDAFMKAFKEAPGLLDEAGPGSKLAALIAGLQASVDARRAAQSGDQGPGAMAAGADPGGAMKKLISTSLSSIGLGGYTSSQSSNPALNESRKQTKLQERTARAIEKIAAGGGPIVKVVPTFG